jgi:hypothetical protein
VHAVAAIVARDVPEDLVGRAPDELRDGAPGVLRVALVMLAVAQVAVEDARRQPE